MVKQSAVNRKILGSTPSWGASIIFSSLERFQMLDKNANNSNGGTRDEFQ